jgi:hypothetical protein
MRTRSLCTIPYIAVTLLLLSLLACDDAVDEKGLSPLAKALMRQIPDGEYSMLGYADLEAFAQSKFGRLLLQFFPSYEDWSKKLGLRVEDLGRLAFAAYAPKSGEQYGTVLLILNGNFSERTVLNFPGVKDLSIKTGKIGDYQVYHLEGGFSFCLPEQGVLFLGSTPMVESALRLNDGEGKALVDGDGLEGFRKFFRTADDFMVAVNGIDRIIDGLEENYPLLQRFEILKAGVVGVDLEEDAHLRIVATCDTAKNAERIANAFQGLVGLLTLIVEGENFSNVSTDIVDIDMDELRGLLVRMLESVEAVSDEEEVTIRASIPRDLIDYIASTTQQVVSHGNERSEQPPPPPSEEAPQ